MITVISAEDTIDTINRLSPFLNIIAGLLVFIFRTKLKEILRQIKEEKQSRKSEDAETKAKVTELEKKVNKLCLDCNTTQTHFENLKDQHDKNHA